MTSLHQLDSSMKVIPAQAGSWLSLVQKSHSAKGGREPYFPKAAQGGDLS